jgi:hypothetical protein
VFFIPCHTCMKRHAITLHLVVFWVSIHILLPGDGSEIAGSVESGGAFGRVIAGAGLV